MGYICFLVYLKKKSGKMKKSQFMFANIVNSLVNPVMRCIVLLVMQIMLTLALDVAREI
jgi:hypothetical protein